MLWNSFKFFQFSLFICNIVPKRSTQYTKLPLIRWWWRFEHVSQWKWKLTLKMALTILGYERIEAGKHVLTHIRITHDTDKCIYLKLNNWNETIVHRLTVYVCTCFHAMIGLIKYCSQFLNSNARIVQSPILDVITSVIP